MNQWALLLGYLAMAAGCIVMALKIILYIAKLLNSFVRKIGREADETMHMWWIIEATHHYAKIKPLPKGAVLLPLDSEKCTQPQL